MAAHVANLSGGVVASIWKHFSSQLLHQCAFGDAEFFEGLDFLHEVFGVGLAAQELLISADRLVGGGFVLVEKFDAKAAETGLAELVEKTGAGLGATMEEGVAAADIGLQAVELAHAVAQMHDVFFAGGNQVFSTSWPSSSVRFMLTMM